MGAFGGLFITNDGKALQAKAQTGTVLQFTIVRVGDGELSGQSISDLHGLISPKMDLAITGLKTQPVGKAIVETILANQDVTTGFYLREIGVFAQDPDVGEILYCYGNAGAGAEYIPAGGGPDIIEKQINLITIVDNAANVSAVIDSSLIYVTQQEFDDTIGPMQTDISENTTATANAQTTANAAQSTASGAQTTVDNHILDISNPHNVTKGQVGLGNVDNVKQASAAELSTHIADNLAHVHYATAVSGTANAKAITLDPAPTAYIEGLALAFKNNIQNTGAAIMNVNGLGSKQLLASDGSFLASGALVANSIYTVRYNGTAFILQGEGGEKIVEAVTKIYSVNHGGVPVSDFGSQYRWQFSFDLTSTFTKISSIVVVPSDNEEDILLNSNQICRLDAALSISVAGGASQENSEIISSSSASDWAQASAQVSFSEGLTAGTISYYFTVNGAFTKSITNNFGGLVGFDVKITGWGSP